LFYQSDARTRKCTHAHTHAQSKSKKWLLIEKWFRLFMSTYDYSFGIKNKRWPFNFKRILVLLIYLKLRMRMSLISHVVTLISSCSLMYFIFEFEFIYNTSSFCSQFKRSRTKVDNSILQEELWWLYGQPYEGRSQ
jgi:hypothetical protein